MPEPLWLQNAKKRGLVFEQKSADLRALQQGARLQPALSEEWSEADFTKAAIAQAHLYGWLAVHWRVSFTKDGRPLTAVQGDGVGYPDLHCVKGNWQIFAELKVKRKKPNTEQLAWLAALAQLPNTITAVWYPKDWPIMTAAFEDPAQR